MVGPVATEAGIRDDERVETVRGHNVFYLLDADGTIVEAPVTSPHFSMACFITDKIMTIQAQIITIADTL